jgi:type VI secretion system protein ImpF
MMARSDNQVRISPSVLDRLIDQEAGVSSEPPASRLKSLRDLKRAVRRDLEWLLNTRRGIEELHADMSEVARSVATYGLPDFTGASLKSPGDQERVRRAIEEAITLFEPRLSDISIKLEPLSEGVPSLRFQVGGYLRVEPEPEPVAFDTMLNLTSNAYEVRGQE